MGKNRESWATMGVMTSDLRNERRDYSGDNLDEAIAPADPMVMFRRWLDEALAARGTDDPFEPTAMTVSTIRVLPDGTAQPSARVLLLKDIDEEGLVFFTNYDSDKGRDLATNPRASLSFFWPTVARQIRFEGTVQKTPRTVSEEYFASRPHSSQVAAWASEQSRSIAGLEALRQRLAAADRRFAGQSVPCPQNWGGYRLQADRAEFWQGQPSRTHDRLVYQRADEGWSLQRLQP